MADGRWQDVQGGSCWGMGVAGWLALELELDSRFALGSWIAVAVLDLGFAIRVIIAIRY
jgi:hypothetical protein